MGIPAYFSYLIKNYKSIIKNLNKTNEEIFHFYLDSNSIIYDCLRSVEFSNDSKKYEEQIIKNVCQKIEFYILSIKPKKSVYIAFDGIAPIAKLEQQRTRRYKSYLLDKINKEINPDYKSGFDRCSITPGTAFMENLNKQLNQYFSNASKYNLTHIYFSGSDEPGEGEHKIFEHIRNNNKTIDNELSVVYGLDADLIMLTLNHLKFNPNLYLFRETPEFIKSIDKSLNPNEQYILNIPQLKNIISDSFSHIDTNSVCSDYIFLCFFLGNDFLPHFPSLNIRSNGINNIMNCYNSVVENSLTIDNSLNWTEIKKLIKELSIQEEEFLIEEYAIRSKFKKRYFDPKNPKYLEERLDNLPILDMKGEDYINPYKSNWQFRYYQELFDIEYDKDIIKEICINYLEGLEWTFKYYNDGCYDWNWCYKYNYPPLLEDLIKYIPSFNTTLIEKKEKNPIHKYTQLSYVLPKNSLSLLPTKVKNKLLEKYQNIYCENCKIIMHFCRYFWESHVELPHIDIKDLNLFILSLNKI